MKYVFGSAAVGVMFWLATMRWFQHAPFLLRAAIALVLLCCAVVASIMVRPERRQP